MSSASAQFGSQSPATLSLPDAIEGDGLLVGWSLETRRHSRPVGFSFGDQVDAAGRAALPILLAGEGHLITIAPTGAGKGVGCVVPSLLRHRGPAIVIDPKGENAAITARRRRDMGQQVIVLDPMGITAFQGGALNPLDLIDPFAPTAVDEAHVVIDQLLAFTSADRDRFWQGRARQLLVGVLFHLLTDLPKQTHTLAEFRALVNRAAGDATALIQALEASRHPEARATGQLFAINAAETVGGIVAFAQEAIDFMRGPALQAATERSSIDFDAVTRGDPLTIYIVMPPHMLGSHGRLLRLWVGALMTAIMRRRARPEASTLFVLDEAAQLGTFNELRQAVTLLRGYGLQTWSFWQDASQLQYLYPDDWQTMVNNSKVVQCFGANTLLAAQTMAGLVGHPDPVGVLALPPDEMLLQVAGDIAVVAKLPNYRLDPAFAGLFDGNPYHDAAADPMGLPRTPLVEYIRPPAPPAPPRPRYDTAVSGIPFPSHEDMAHRILEAVGAGKG
ncbi:type IV secretory system conjugative DNA transfer family protein [Sphingopyxis panaciterrulae]|uniref:Type IV secretion system protein VirD4 n=1 Tax=Sphingopyxis panaciterrulae TaxID=462372 RepID=A0A7W9B9G3_9SPHN|nr:type IV secretory system conjugative DNA transfer family protein [Sphingopyxis panaciterrulae]MBB5708671.1 type IV secretion system protein VirD4 [Sphingopyxis panaciterrulae]